MKKLLIILSLIITSSCSDYKKEIFFSQECTSPTAGETIYKNNEIYSQTKYLIDIDGQPLKMIEKYEEGILYEREVFSNNNGEYFKVKEKH